jgi:tetratricopeptide (TPR) repeat protein
MHHTEDGNRAWELVQKGDAETAIPIFERLIGDNPNVGDWNNYGDALLMVGRTKAAEDAYRRVRTLPHPHGFTSDSVGTALWLQGRYSDACADWREELDRIMTTKLKRYNAAGVFICCLLWWAYRRLEMPEMWSELQPQIKLVLKTRGQQEVWGLTIMQFIVDGITPNEFLEIAPDPYEVGNKDPTNRASMRLISQAHFYVAGKHDIGSAGWTNHLELAANLGTPAALDMAERNIAKYEFARS